MRILANKKPEEPDSECIMVEKDLSSIPTSDWPGPGQTVPKCGPLDPEFVTSLVPRLSIKCLPSRCRTDGKRQEESASDVRLARPGQTRPKYGPLHPLPPSCQYQYFAAHPLSLLYFPLQGNWRVA